MACSTGSRSALTRIGFGFVGKVDYDYTDGRMVTCNAADDTSNHPVLDKLTGLLAHDPGIITTAFIAKAQALGISDHRRAISPRGCRD